MSTQDSSGGKPPMIRLSNNVPTTKRTLLSSRKRSLVQTETQKSLAAILDGKYKRPRPIAKPRVSTSNANVVSAEDTTHKWRQLATTESPLANGFGTSALLTSAPKYKAAVPLSSAGSKASATDTKSRSTTGPTHTKRIRPAQNDNKAHALSQSIKHVRNSSSAFPEDNSKTMLSPSLEANIDTNSTDGDTIKIVALNLSTSRSNRERISLNSKVKAVSNHDETAENLLDTNPACDATISITSEQVGNLQEPIIPLRSTPTAALPTQKRPSVLEDIPRPTSTTTSSENKSSLRSSSSNNDNFVRLNMRNKAGACRGAQNKKTSRRSKSRYDKTGHASNDTSSQSNHHTTATDMNTNNPSTNNMLAAHKRFKDQSIVDTIDPIDDYLDGTYKPKVADTKKGKASTTSIHGSVPLCPGHQLSCKLVKVKSNAKGNKGRSFYTCSLSREDQCKFFQWKEDAVDEIVKSLNKSSTSDFITRQVAAYIKPMKALTVPELRKFAKEHSLSDIGKKQEILMRIALWVRDEIDQATSARNSPVAENKAEPLLSLKNKLEKLRGTEIELDELYFDEPDDSSDHGLDSLDYDENIRLRNSAEENAKGSDDIIQESYQAPVGANETEVSSSITRTIDTQSGRSSICDTDTADRSEMLHSSLLSYFHYSTFREGQQWAVERCLDGKRSLLIAPTGFGKSLCYALPAALSEGVCVVVSPLVSLIQDQIRTLPPSIPATTLSGSLSRSQLASTIDDIIRGRFKIVFVSPERLVSPSFLRLFRRKWDPATKSYKRMFPTLSLLCIDEAHCISQWGHYFRPSYLRLKAIVDTLDAKSVLAMTATAGLKVKHDICNILSIGTHESSQGEVDKDYNDCTKSVGCARENIHVQCVLQRSQHERLQTLIEVLRGDLPIVQRSDDFVTGSVIVYTWRQLDAESIAENIVAGGIEGGVVVYHGGMSANSRETAQSKFLRGKARICVATVAFGLGINKSDIRGIVHMYLPSSPENHLQEIGRAGRDGQDASALALILEDEVNVKHSLAHTDMLCSSQIDSFMQSLRRNIDDSLSVLTNEQLSLYDRVTVAVPLNELLPSTGCKVEAVETLMSLLESLFDTPMLRYTGLNADVVTITPKRSSIEDLAKKVSIVNAIIQCSMDDTDVSKRRYQYHGNNIDEEAAYAQSSTFKPYKFSVAKCATIIGPDCETRNVYAALRQMQDNGDIELQMTTGGYGGTDRAVVFTVPKEYWFLSRDDQSKYFKECSKQLYRCNREIIDAASSKVLDIDSILRYTADDGSDRYHQLVQSYFQDDTCTDRYCKATFDKISDTDKLDYQTYQIMSHLKECFSAAQSHVANPFDAAANDLTALCTTKFLHGIAPFSLSLLRHHPLFGMLRTTQFQELYDCILQLLDSETKQT